MESRGASADNTSSVEGVIMDRTDDYVEGSNASISNVEQVQPQDNSAQKRTNDIALGSSNSSSNIYSSPSSLLRQQSQSQTFSHHQQQGQSADPAVGAQQSQFPSQYQYQANKMFVDTPPASSLPSEPYDTGNSVSSGNNNLESSGSSSLYSKLLHEAFASLSLTDKCALSLSMSQKNNDITPNNGSVHSTPRAMNKTAGSSSNLNLKLNLSAVDAHTSNNNNGTNSNCSTARAGAADNWVSETGSLMEASGNGRDLVDEMSEMQSVLSETDKEALDKAMLMMGHSDLCRVEDEVKYFINNNALMFTAHLFLNFSQLNLLPMPCYISCCRFVQSKITCVGGSSVRTTQT